MGRRDSEREAILAEQFALWGASGRVGVDFLRTDPTRAFGRTGTQLALVAVILVTGTWLVVRARRGNPAGQSTEASAAGSLAFPVAPALAGAKARPGWGAEGYDTP